MEKFTVHVDETVMTAAQKTEFNKHLKYWRESGFAVEVGPPAKPRPQ